MTSAPPSPTISPPTSHVPDLGGGIPSLEDVDRLHAGPFWQEVQDFNADFLRRHRKAVAGYAWHWGMDPLKFWSRRWEYPFAAAAVLRHAATAETDALRVADAGSGVTFFPYFLADRLPRARVTCCDYAATYAPIFAAINRNESHDRVDFVRASLQTLPFDDGELDVLCCVSVLEHTGDYERVAKEAARVVRPGGRFVVTFDVSQDDTFEVQPKHAARFFKALQEGFDVDADALDREARRALTPEADGLLCTPAVKRVSPELLPWKFPRLQAVYDLVRGYGWTGGFRACACFALDAARRG